MTGGDIETKVDNQIQVSDSVSHQQIPPDQVSATAAVVTDIMTSLKN